MTLVFDFLDHVRAQGLAIDLDRPDALECVLITPRFRASRHVVFLLVRHRDATPVMVAKVARLPGFRDSSDREASNLVAAHAAVPGGFASIPRLIACDLFRGHSILLESALSGRAIDQTAVRRRPAHRLHAVCDWLERFQQAHRSAAEPPRPVDATLDATFAILDRHLQDGELRRTVEWTRRMVEPLRGRIEGAFEHGDLSHPNLLELDDGGVGVLDWESADPEGVPGRDLFFFLAYAGVALRRARTVETQRRAFQETFFEPNRLVEDVTERYGRALGVEREALRLLFPFTWARCVADFLVRLGAGRATGNSSSPVVEWLLEHRYTAYWRDTARLWERLRW